MKQLIIGRNQQYDVLQSVKFGKFRGDNVSGTLYTLTVDEIANDVPAIITDSGDVLLPQNWQNVQPKTFDSLCRTVWEPVEVIN